MISRLKKFDHPAPVVHLPLSAVIQGREGVGVGWEDSLQSRASDQPIDSAGTIFVSESCETSNDPQVFISPPAHVQDGTGLERMSKTGQVSSAVTLLVLKEVGSWVYEQQLQ